MKAHVRACVRAYERSLVITFSVNLSWTSRPFCWFADQSGTVHFYACGVTLVGNFNKLKGFLVDKNINTGSIIY